MSSPGQFERFEIGARVAARDGELGELARVIVDPVAQTLTHLVVKPRHHDEEARMAPVDLVEAVDRDRILLGTTVANFARLDRAEEAQFVPTGIDPAGFGPNVLAQPFYGLETSQGVAPFGSQPIYEDRIPAGEVTIRRGDQVHASDGWIGAVEGLVIDPADHHVTHVLLQEGHLWGRRQVAIPIGAAGRVGNDIQVELTKQQIEDLPPVKLTG